MKIIKLALALAATLVLFSGTTASAQTTVNSLELNFHPTPVSIVQPGDTLYSGTVKINLSDSLNISSIHVSVNEVGNTQPLSDQTVTYSSLPVSYTPAAWRDGKTVFVRSGSFSVFVRYHVEVEVFDLNGQRSAFFIREF